MKRFLLAVLCLIWTVAAALAQEFAPNHLLVKPIPGIQAQDFGAELRWTFASGAQLWILPDEWAVQDAGSQLEAASLVEYAEPDPIVYAQDVPNDQYFGSQWAWPVIHAPDAWTLEKGDRSVVVGIVDTGITLDHPDLSCNLWTAPDGTHGYDAWDDDLDPTDIHGHGTHVSGTVGACTNNTFGVAGVNWQVSLMGLRFLGPCGGGLTSDAIKAIDWGVAHGANILSNSWGCGPSAGCFSQALKDSIAGAGSAGVLFVDAAGNSGVRLDVGCTFYPACYGLPNQIAVAASDQSDNRASFSNYGPAVDLAAPGVGIYSTFACASKLCSPLHNGFGNLSGTSMACPHVAGAAALLKHLHPDWTVAEVKSAILTSVDVLPQWSGLVVSNGRLNLARAVGVAEPPPPPPNPCGNGICDESETCRTCAADCAGRLNKQPWTRFCCGDGIKQAPEGDGVICGGNF